MSIPTERIEPASQRPPERVPLRVLITVGRTQIASEIRKRLAASGYECESRSDANRAERLLRSEPYDLLICDDRFPTTVASSLIEALRSGDPASGAIWLADEASVAETVAAVRIGFNDIVSLPLRGEELLRRVDAVAGRLEPLRRRSQRLARWKQVCRQLNRARHEADRRSGELAGNLEGIERDRRREIDDAVVSSEFRTLLRQELDVESLLRTAMEYMLTRTGPTNAAVFLNNGNERWGLGAYVNYRIPRASIAVALDRISEEVCAGVAEQEGLLRFGDVAEFVESVGPEAEPLADQEIIAFGCHHEGKCLAVVVLFRDRREPFAEPTAGALDLMRQVLAQQMAAIVRIHHRASPQWPQEAADDRDEGEWDAAA
jgi:DNA-binding response OmpR family regulator